MSNLAPAQKRDRSAPYSEVFGVVDIAAPIDLTTRVVSAAAAGAPQVAPYQNACSQLIVIPKTTGAIALTWKDTAGRSNALTTAVAAALSGNPIHIPVAAIELTSSTNVIVIVLWHGTNGPQR